MTIPAWVFGSLAGLAVVFTWFIPAVRSSARLRIPRSRDGRMTLGDLVELRHAQAFARSALDPIGPKAKECAYCGATTDLRDSHLVPASIHVNDRCDTCATIGSIDNRILACGPCDDRRSKAGLYELFEQLHRDVPARVERKYLKTARACLGCAGALDGVARRVGVRDIDAALGPLV